MLTVNGSDWNDKCLENFLEDDVISQIFDGGHILKFTGEDYREKIREAGGEKL